MGGFSSSDASAVDSSHAKWLADLVDSVSYGKASNNDLWDLFTVDSDGKVDTTKLKDDKDRDENKKRLAGRILILQDEHLKDYISQMHTTDSAGKSVNICWNPDGTSDDKAIKSDKLFSDLSDAVGNTSSSSSSSSSSSNCPACPPAVTNDDIKPYSAAIKFLLTHIENINTAITAETVTAIDTDLTALLNAPDTTEAYAAILKKKFADSATHIGTDDGVLKAFVDSTSTTTPSTDPTDSTTTSTTTDSSVKWVDATADGYVANCNALLQTLYKVVESINADIGALGKKQSESYGYYSSGCGCGCNRVGRKVVALLVLLIFFVAAIGLFYYTYRKELKVDDDSSSASFGGYQFRSW